MILGESVTGKDTKKKGSEPPVFLSTHPSSKKRIQNLENWIREVIIEYPPISAKANLVSPDGLEPSRPP